MGIHIGEFPDAGNCRAHETRVSPLFLQRKDTGTFLTWIFPGLGREGIFPDVRVDI